MKKTFKRTAVLALIGAVTVGMLAGCGDKKAAALDGTAVVATVDGAEIPMGVLSLYTRQQQAQTESLYLMYLGSTANIWDTVVDEESGETYGAQLVNSALEQMELNYVMRDRAADYGVEITEEDKTAIQEAAKTFMESNSEETLTTLAVTQEQVEEFLELETVSTRMYYALRAETEVNITDEEAQQSSFSYVSLQTAGDDLTEEDIQKRRDNAKSLLDSMLADPTADMNETAAALDETYSGLTGTYTKSADAEDSSSYPDEVLEVLRGLKDGEVYDQVLEVEDTLYVLRKDLDVDEDATESRRSTLEDNARTAHYTELTQEWLKNAVIEVKDDVLKTLVVDDSNNFSYFTPTATPAPEEAAAEETTEEAAVEETAEETAEEAPAEEAAEETSEEAPAEEAAGETVEEAPAEETAEETAEDTAAENN